MTLLTCAAVRRRLAAYHDRELPVPELIAVEAHVQDCPPCHRELRKLQAIGDRLRLAAAPGPADDWTGLAPGVISRMRAEDSQSWSARAGRLFEDLHLVWIGLASATATVICGGVVLGMLHFASAERQDSLGAVIAMMAAPPGSDLNPLSFNNVIRAPSLPTTGGVVIDTLESRASDEDLVFAVSAMVSREGRVSDVSILTTDHDRHEVDEILSAISRGRLEPARFAGAPVAVNLVWLVAQTTVKGKVS
ncbi:MAG TPA: zf-HC2 domain-containing protein [Vicinamibacterales bacterium]|jgi:hypothetical protein|nr:zf-HC2 domain-containing protein [Vicinamibacterales bacterium]